MKKTLIVVAAVTVCVFLYGCSPYAESMDPDPGFNRPVQLPRNLSAFDRYAFENARSGWEAMDITCYTFEVHYLREHFLPYFFRITVRKGETTDIEYIRWTSGRYLCDVSRDSWINRTFQMWGTIPKVFGSIEAEYQNIWRSVFTGVSVGIRDGFCCDAFATVHFDVTYDAEYHVPLRMHGYVRVYPWHPFCMLWSPDGSQVELRNFQLLRDSQPPPCDGSGGGDIRPPLCDLGGDGDCQC